MNVVISIAEHEIEMAHRWFDWVIELGGTAGHALFLMPAANARVADVGIKASKAFGGRISILKDDEAETSDWQVTEALRSAAGPNSAFRQVAWHFFHKKLGPYFWCELDCIPLKKDWLDRLEIEYRSCGKPFMGAYVEIAMVPVHMSGNAIYVNVPIEAPALIMRTEWTPRDQEQSFELAFDIAGAAEVLPKAHWTKLIQHKFRYEGFKNRAEFDAVIDPNAVVFHSDKKGTIYQYLRQNFSVSDASNKIEVATDGRNAEGGTAPKPVEVNAGASVARPNSGNEIPREISRDELVKQTVAVLKSLCTSPHATSQVRKELKRQKVISKC